VGASVRIGIDVVTNVDQQNAIPIHIQSHHFTAPKVV
jgi:hypothetical protein